MTLTVTLPWPTLAGAALVLLGVGVIGWWLAARYSPATAPHPYLLAARRRQGDSP